MQATEINDRLADECHGYDLDGNPLVTNEEIEAMIAAAFQVLAVRHPECTSGDMDPIVLAELHRVISAAARLWVMMNTPCSA